jgi:hypothetical protein
MAQHAAVVHILRHAVREYYRRDSVTGDVGIRHADHMALSIRKSWN